MKSAMKQLGVLGRVKPRKPLTKDRVAIQARVQPEFRTKFYEVCKKNGLHFEDVIVAGIEQFLSEVK